MTLSFGNMLRAVLLMFIIFSIWGSRLVYENKKRDPTFENIWITLYSVVCKIH